MTAGAARAMGQELSRGLRAFIQLEDLCVPLQCL